MVKAPEAILQIRFDFNLSFICLDGIEISTDVSACCFAVVLVFDRRLMVSMFKLASLAQ